MKIIEAWQIYRWDGGERHNPTDTYLATKELSEQYRDHPDGSKYDSVFHKVLVVVESMDELKELKQSEVRKRALAKLTPLEIQALGLGV